MKDYLKLAYVSLKNRKLRSWLTMIGIFIGIAAVISLIGLGQGLRLAVMSQFNFLSTDVLTVQASGLQQGPPGEGVVKSLVDKQVKDIDHLPGVAMAISRIIQRAKLEFNGRSDFTFAGSMPDGAARQELTRIATFELKEGVMLKDGDTRKVVLGNNYGKSDTFGKAIHPRDKVLVQGKEFEVVGILQRKGSFIIDNVIVMNEADVKSLFTIKDEVSLILVKVASGTSLATMKDRLENYMRKERHVKKGEEDFQVQSPEQVLKNLDATLFAIQLFVYVIAGISLVVGGIGIANTMYTAVLERTKEIGIMKALGAKRNTIFGLFLIESGFFGLLGGIIGILLGMSVDYGLAFVGQQVLHTDFLRVSLQWYLIVGALLFSFIIGSLAGMLPAYQASQLRPVDALRYTR